MNHVSAVSNMIHAGVDLCMSHIEKASRGIAECRMEEGYMHLQNALMVSSFIRKYAVESGYRNAPVVSQALERLVHVIHTLDDVYRIQGWGEKFARYKNKKRKIGLDYENISVEIEKEVRAMRPSPYHR